MDDEDSEAKKDSDASFESCEDGLIMRVFTLRSRDETMAEMMN